MQSMWLGSLSWRDACMEVLGECTFRARIPHVQRGGSASAALRRARPQEMRLSEFCRMIFFDVSDYPGGADEHEEVVVIVASKRVIKRRHWAFFADPAPPQVTPIVRCEKTVNVPS